MRSSIGRAEAAGARGIKSEASVILRVTEDKYGLPTQVLCTLKRCAHQLASDSRALLTRHHRKRRETECRKWRFHTGQQNVTGDDRIGIERYERDNHAAVYAQAVYEIGLLRAAERSGYDSVNGRAIGWLFSPYVHVRPGAKVQIGLHRFGKQIQWRRGRGNPGARDNMRSTINQRQG